MDKAAAKVPKGATKKPKEPKDPNGKTPAKRKPARDDVGKAKKQKAGKRKGMAA
jgi:hypothetical protein